jgi:radical SAM protein with 4Fe4S-binding SPASM domain
MSAEQPRRLEVLGTPSFRPHYVVWELTLACDQPCTHCGSRAGEARERELTTERAVEVAGELAQAGAREVVLIGGEAYLHPGFLDVVRALVAAGVVASLTTGGWGVTPELARTMYGAGLCQASVSVDGLQPTHDLLRARRGSFAQAFRALTALREAGIKISANTNLNRVNFAELEALYEALREAGVRAWQVQLTAPLGRAADRTEMLLQPYDLLTLFPRIAALKQRAFTQGILLFAANNLGYFGPEEALLRSTEQGVPEHFQGCPAGRHAMGIESDGAVKGCPSLQTAHYVGGTLTNGSVATLWNTPEVGFARTRTRADLWGFCATCSYADVCMGGCTFTAHAFFGRPGNQPYCHYRALALQRAGRRERLVPDTPAKGLPFDNGAFALVEEPWDAPEPPSAFGGGAPSHLVRVTRKPG